MKTVPSLVASSTVGIAAVGLTLGKQESPRPHSKRRRVGDNIDLLNQALDRSSLSSRPSTSPNFLIDHDYPQAFLAGGPTTPSAKSHRRPPLPQMDTHTYSDKQRPSSAQPLSTILPDEIPFEDSKRESLSSRGSWMRRLSALPLSYQNTLQVSTTLDSSLPSNSSSTKHSSSVSKPVLQSRNKLVKRNQTSRGAASSPDALQTIRSKIATIRRPATSHQRSVLQQQHFEELPGTRKDYSADSFLNLTPPPGESYATQSRVSWQIYFETRPLLSIMQRTSGRIDDGRDSDDPTISKRVFIDKNSSPTLIKPEMIVSHKSQDLADHDDEIYGLEGSNNEATCHSSEIGAPEIKPSPSDTTKIPHRSYSIQFGSSIPWLSRSGSFRGPKKDANSKLRGRCSSVPLCVPSGFENVPTVSLVKKRRTALCLSMFHKELSINTKSDNLAQSSSTDHKKHPQSCPVEFLSVSQLSSLSDDLARFGLSTSSAAICGDSSNHSSPTSQVTKDLNSPFSSTVFESFTAATCFPTKELPSSNVNEATDRASTLIGSDSDFKGIVLGEEDDTDFQSETVFDSLRSGVTDSIRSHNPLLDSIFDESPSISEKYHKYKRCSVHEILSSEQFKDGSKKIDEETEVVPYSPRDPRQLSPELQELSAPVCAKISIDGSIPSPCVITAKMSAESFHFDDDEDWTRDEESLGKVKIESSSGPPKPSTRYQNLCVVPQHSATKPLARSEIPKNNVFDWSEPSSINRFGLPNGSPRPRTAHVKQLTDGRGGRSLGRRGPSALHIRSQSVPVVPDLDAAKLTSKFGTWGLGSKAISEDWDGDFEFDNVESSNSNEGKTSGVTNGVLVPEAIQASQENIAGHVGQIREVCLLVEDLKRLRLLGKSQGLLDGELAPLWQQAEGIIALAAPVEDEKLEEPYSHITAVPFGDDDQVKSPKNKSQSITDTSDWTTNLHDCSRESPLSEHRKSIPSLSDGSPGASSNIQNSPKGLSRPSFSLSRKISSSSPTEVARKVMESMHQQRSSSDPLMQNFFEDSGNKMPFDTTSLKDLVHRAASLTRTLGDAVRVVDDRSSSHGLVRDIDPSPAFTRVFTDPISTSPKSLPQSQSKNSILSNSIDISPQRGLSQHMHMMAVN
ncbi:hypothetical protein K3495_g7904 [Podosphaera aphanis]|nr:hypothetical protein K3495_g7904 [Podosphaera aphanis]